jgi:hypothetical protein
MRFHFAVMRSNNSNIILANLSFDDDHVFMVVVVAAAVTV